MIAKTGMLLPLILLILIILSGAITNITKNAEQKNIHLISDKNSLLFFRIFFPVSVFISFVFCYLEIGQLKDNVFVDGIGILLFSIGIVIRWSAILSLKKEYTVKVSILKDHELKTNGIYKTIRHPSYTGLIIYYSGLAFTLHNWISFVVLLTTVVIVIFNRIRQEEKILKQHFGSDYTTYMKKTYALIPGIY